MILEYVMGGGLLVSIVGGYLISKPLRPKKRIRRTKIEMEAARRAAEHMVSDKEMQKALAVYIKREEASTLVSEASQSIDLLDQRLQAVEAFCDLMAQGMKRKAR